MDPIHDQPLAGTCAKGTLWGLTRTGGLIMGAVLASILLVDPPIPAGRAAEAPPYVPAGETWIEPKAAARPDTTVEAPAADRAEETGRKGDFAAERKPRKSRGRRDG
jgi:hypothetical protein